MKNLSRLGPLVFAGSVFLGVATFIGPFEDDVEMQNAIPEHREWILKCIENGNPRAEYSSPKELIRTCSETSKALFPIRLEE